MILRSPDGDGGGNAFLATLPTELQSEPSLQTFKDVGSLAKSHVEAQKLIGAKRIALPGEKATDAEWESFYNSIGRPGTPDAYEVPKLELEPEVVLDKDKLALTKQALHKLGLTMRQATGVMQHYLESVNSGVKAGKATSAGNAANAVNALRAEWADKFDANVDIARSVIKKFGGEQANDIAAYMDSSGLGNNVPLVRLMHAIGMSILEDTGRRGGGGGGSLNLNDQTRALHEIEQLKLDADFQKAMGDPRNPGHASAVNRWLEAHKIAYPGKVQDS